MTSNRDVGPQSKLQEESAASHQGYQGVCYEGYGMHYLIRISRTQLMYEWLLI